MSAATPLYIKICDTIQHKIESQHYPQNSQLPTEYALMAEYSASRVTIRKSIELLKSRNMVQTHHGLGTFVSHIPTIYPTISHAQHLLVKSFSELIKDLDMIPSTKFIEISTITNPSHFHQKLNVPETEVLLVTKRIRYANQLPITYEENVFLHKHFDFLIDSDLSQSLFHILSQHNIIPHSAQWVELAAVSPTNTIAKHLQVSMYCPILHQSELIMIKDSPLTYLSEHYFIGNRYKFFMRES